MCLLKTKKVRILLGALSLYKRSLLFADLVVFDFVWSGWWLVENEAKRLAWFPAPYLQRAEMSDDGPDVMEDGSKDWFSVF